jgi:hypothetical protein
VAKDWKKTMFYYAHFAVRSKGEKTKIKDGREFSAHLLF